MREDCSSYSPPALCNWRRVLRLGFDILPTRLLHSHTSCLLPSGYLRFFHSGYSDRSLPRIIISLPHRTLSKWPQNVTTASQFLPVTNFFSLTASHQESVFVSRLRLILAWERSSLVRRCCRRTLRRVLPARAAACVAQPRSHGRCFAAKCIQFLVIGANVDH